MDNRQTERRRPPGQQSPAGGSRQGAATAAPTRRRRQQSRPAQKRPDREIVYTPAKPFNRKRLLLQLIMVAAVVLAVFLTLSLFFRVRVDHKDSRTGKHITTITVSGNEKYSANAVVKASGIKDGDNLLTLNDARISSRIITKLPYVKSVRIGIKLPDTVNIEIEELDVVYSIADRSGQWWLVTSDGRVVEKTDAAGATEHTKLLGVSLSAPTAGKQAVAAETTYTASGEDGETAPVTISGAQRLETALGIAAELEKNGVLGQVVTIDVTNMGALELWYGQRFRILLGDTSDLEKKIYMAMTAATEQLADYDRGTLDASFADREEEVIYTPESN